MDKLIEASTPTSIFYRDDVVFSFPDEASVRRPQQAGPRRSATVTSVQCTVSRLEAMI